MGDYFAKFGCCKKNKEKSRSPRTAAAVELFATKKSYLDKRLV